MLVAIVIFAQWSLADSLYTQHYYELAQIEYQREFFFNPGLRKDQHKRLRYAIALMAKNASRGAEEFSLMTHEFPDLKPEITIEMAKYLLYLGDYYRARELLLKTDEKKLVGLTYLLDDELSKAHHLFMTTGDHGIARDIEAYRNKPKKSIETATFLSLICPGAGEIYAGNIASGVRGFLLNAGSGYLLYNALKKEKYVDALLIFNFLIQRFYLGSLYNAQKSVMEANDRARQEWLSEMQKRLFQDLDVDY